MGISREDALDCFNSDDLIGIGMEADAVRRRLHPEGVVSYTIDGTIDYGAQENPRQTALSSAAFEGICNRINEIVAMGGTGVTLQSEAPPEQPIAWFEGLFANIRERS